MAEGKPSGLANARGRFAAFISYAHADAAMAAKLQSRLERYRLPKHIAAAHAEGQAALGKIFRDREDLAAAPSLSEAIRAAISEAEALVVLCSPDAKVSRWVGEEIALFRALHPDRPILAALVQGEPEEAFPAALTEGGVEPLAADLRKEGDGEALGFLKIVAGIAGVPLDTLVQRDAQRRLRRVTWITGGALAAMLVMGVMTAFAIQQRNEAARQRAEAEGLVEYMLTDLREKLKGVGRLDVMEAVNERAMRHYQRQGNLDTLSADSLVRRARVLHQLGEDDEKRGQLKRALANFAQAHRATAEVLAQKPDDPETIIAHAQSEYWLGYAKQKNGKPIGAIKAYQSYLNLAGLAAVKGLSTLQSERHKGWAHNAMGVVYFEHLKDNKRATLNFEKYRDKFALLLAQNPSDLEVLYSLADAHAWLAQVAATEGRLDQAVRERKKQIALLDRLFEIDPQNDQPIWSKIGAERELFRACFSKNDYPCAKAALGRARQILQSRDFDKANRDWLWQSAYMAIDEGFLAEKMGNAKNARAALRSAQHFSVLYNQASEGDRDEVRTLNNTINVLSQKLN